MLLGLLGILIGIVFILAFTLPVPKHKRKQLEEMQRIIIFGE